MRVEAAAVMLERLAAVDWVAWEPAFEHAEERARLMREYLRRAARWAEAVGGADGWPFCDLAGSVDSGAEVEAGVAARLAGVVEGVGDGSNGAKICRAAVRWASLGEDVVVGYGLPDPYEPLVAMVELGGAVTMENGMIDFVTTRVRVRSWRDHLD
ncbi:hypothetical protein ACIA8O_20010 [Kitasatospora sp. NPDC051853]|uniref:hypothetical protein n=1 Tax=Kitasatospora sp. NPDC051853 TaxID=3364058 RepID=UPI0037B088C6